MGVKKMYWTNPHGQLYAPWVAAWWLTGVAGLYWWAGLSAYPEQETRVPQLRLVAVNGKLLRS
jgi:hypothetical protein